ncbi:Thymidylate synthase 2 [compost metagenome]
MESYLGLLQYVLENGKERKDRTGTGTLSVFGTTLKFDLQAGFPLVTTKRIHIKSVVHELLWMLKGNRNGDITYLLDNGVRIWKEWADENNHLGPVYGAQWRRWQAHEPDTINLYDESGNVVLTLPYDGYNVAYIDQLKETIENIKTDPYSRRHLISAWNPADLHAMRLPPCHYAYQFYVSDGKLSCMVQMRSVDLFLGLPFDIASYALQTHMVAQVTGLEVGELLFNFGDTHIYLNHINQVIEQLSREPGPLPTLELSPYVVDIDGFKFDDIKIIGYDPHPTIKGEISI